MKTVEQLGDELCKYCKDTDFGDNKEYTSADNYWSCEGRWCDKAYQNYLEENNLENELILEDNKNGK